MFKSANFLIKELITHPTTIKLVLQASSLTESLEVDLKSLNLAKSGNECKKFLLIMHYGVDI